MTSRKLGNRRFLKPGCDQLFRAARNDNQACKRGARRAGEVYTVRYDAVNAMLLNEFLKEHRKVEKLEAMVAQQRKEFEAALTDLKGQIQKVSAQLEAEQSRAANRRRKSVNLRASQLAVTLHRVAAFCFTRSRLFEIARVLVRFDHVARFIVNANHSIM